jgi:solute carrier family 31 (copper transporter), member 1
VICLVIVLEALRRASREYDAYIGRAWLAAHPPLAAPMNDSDSDNKNGATVQTSAVPIMTKGFTPNLFQQTVRAFLHMLQFAVAYFVMLLAMYFNGYIIICIFIGAFLGAFIFSWHRLNLP